MALPPSLRMVALKPSRCGRGLPEDRRPPGRCAGPRAPYRFRGRRGQGVRRSWLVWHASMRMRSCAWISFIVVPCVFVVVLAPVFILVVIIFRKRRHLILLTACNFNSCGRQMILAHGRQNNFCRHCTRRVGTCWPNSLHLFLTSHGQEQCRRPHFPTMFRFVAFRFFFLCRCVYFDVVVGLGTL